LEPLTIAGADLDGDGTIDLVTGYRAGAEGVIEIRRGRPEAIFPDDPAYGLSAEDFWGVSPFSAEAFRVRVPIAPEVLAIGDLDFDGKSDIVFAHHDVPRLYWLNGTGEGFFASAKSRELGGFPAFMRFVETAGPSRPPGLVLVLSKGSGWEVQLFSELLARSGSEPLSLTTGSKPVAVLPDASGEPGQLAVLLVLEDAILRVHPPSTHSLPVPVKLDIRSTSLSFRAAAAGLGDFIWDRLHQPELAILAADGKLHFMRQSNEPESRIALGFKVPGAVDWVEIESRLTPLLVPPGSPFQILTSRSSSLPVDTLLLLSEYGVQVLAGDATGWKESEPKAPLAGTVSTDDAILLDSRPALAAFSARLNMDALDDLVLLRKGSAEPLVSLTRPMSSFTVNQSGSADDASGGDGVCDSNLQLAGHQCTLHAAIQQANLNPGADYIGFQVDYVDIGESLPDIIDPVTIEGKVGGTGRAVWIDGSTNGMGMDVDAGNSAIRNLVINGAMDPDVEGYYAGNSGLSLNYNGSNIVEGCWFGIDRNGSLAKPNFSGLAIHDSSSNTIGGSDQRARNVISGNRAHGMSIEGSSNNNTVTGNYIGADSLGYNPVSNQVFGVILTDYSDGSGEYSPRPKDNLLYHNVIVATQRETPDFDPQGVTGVGIILQADGTTLRANFIGMAEDGETGMGNQGAGIWVLDGAANVIEGNRIAFNGGDGIAVIESNLERTQRGYAGISRNSIYSNAGLGINLAPGWPLDAVTPNDNLDTDSGPNELQNFPELALNQTRDGIGITLRSKPNTHYRFEVFSSPGCDPSGYGEGKTYLQPESWFGTPYDLEGTTDGKGELYVSASLTIPIDQVLTATATDPLGNTSEFSQCAGEAGPAIELTPRLILGLGLCGNAAREIQVKDLVKDKIITTDPDVSYEWIRPNGLSTQLAMDVLNYWASKTVGMQIPSDAIAQIAVSNGLVTFLTPGVNVLQATRTLPGGQLVKSNYSLLIGGELQLGEVESLDIAPWALTSPATNLATDLTQQFLHYMEWMEPGQDLDAPMVLFPPSGQACSPLIGALGNYGQTTVKSLKFKLFNGWLSGVDLMAGFNLLGQLPAKHWLLGLAKAIGKTAPVSVAQFMTYQSMYEIANPDQTDPFMEVVGQFGESAPYIAGFVTAKASGLTGIQATFEMNSFCIEGKATDLMPVLVLPDLEKVDIRNELGVVEEPIEVGLNQTRDTHAVGMFNAFTSASRAYDIAFDPLGQTGERLRDLAEKVVPGGRKVLDKVNIPIPVTFPWGATLTDGLYLGGHYYFGAGFSWMPLSAKVRIDSLKFQTLLPDFLADWEMNPIPNPIAESIEGDPLSLTDNDRVRGLKAGLTQVDLDVCVVLTSLSRRNDSNGVKVVGGNRIRVQKFEDLRADGAKDSNDPGLDGWTIYLQRVDNGKIVAAVTGPVDLNEDSSIDEQEHGWAVFEDLEPTLYRIFEKEAQGWTRTTGEPALIPLGADQTVVARIGNFKHITIRGKKFEDQDGDGVLDAGEPGLPGWQIEVDLNSDGSVEHAAVTDSGGNYRFADIGLGDLKGDRTFRVNEVLQVGWFATFPLDDEPIPFFSGSEILIDFGNFRGMNVRGVKFNDLNGNGLQDTGEPPLAGWTVRVDLNADGAVDLTQVTDAAGAFQFVGVGPGDPNKDRTFTVREVLQTGWIQTFPGDDEAYPIHSGLQVVADFGNFRLARWCGAKFNDMNGNGVRDAEDAGLGGWSIELEKPSGGILKATTGANGGYCFGELGPGLHKVREVLLTGWIRTFPAGSGVHQFNTESGKDRNNLDFGNFKKAKLCGVKFEDLDNSGQPDNNSGLTAWQIQLTDPTGARTTTSTSTGGGYCFNDLGPGSFTVAEIQQTGWTQTVPAAPGIYTRTLKSGDDLRNLYFGNRRAGGFVPVQLCGIKFEDVNGNGVKDPGDPGLPGWTITLRTTSEALLQTTTTAADGKYCFGSVGQGTFVIRENATVGWAQTLPASGKLQVTTVSGVNRDDLHLGNFRLAVLSGLKYNDANRNGTREAAEKGLSGWTVFLDQNSDGVLNHPRAEGTCDQAAQEPCRLTDAQGLYSFSDLPAGDYRVLEVNQPGWVRTSALPETIRVDRSGFTRGNINFGNAPAPVVKTLYYPFYQGNSQFFTAFAASNYSDKPASLRFTSYGSDGTLNAFPVNPAVVQLAARHQLARLGNELFGCSASTVQSGWVRLESDNGDIGSFFQFGDLAVTGLDGSTGVLETAGRLIFTRVYHAPLGLETALSIANPGSVPADVVLRLTDVGEVVYSQAKPMEVEISRVIPPNGVLYGTVADLFGDLPEIYGQVEVQLQEGAGVVGFGMIDQKSPKALIGLGAATDFGSAEGYSAQLASGPGLFTTLKLFNRGDDFRYIYLEVRGDKGEELAGGYTYLWPGEQYETEVGWLFEADPESYFIGSLLMEADGPGIFGDVLFGDMAGRYAAALPLQTGLFTKAVFNHVANGLGFFTGLALFNPGLDVAEVAIEVYSIDGKLKGSKQLTIQPGARLSNTLWELVPETGGQLGGYIVVQSSRLLVGQQLFGLNNLTLLSAVPPTVVE